MSALCYLRVGGREVAYVPCASVADSDDLACRGARVLLRHVLKSAPVFVVAPRGELTSGWVIGFVAED